MDPNSEEFYFASPSTKIKVSCHLDLHTYVYACVTEHTKITMVVCEVLKIVCTVKEILSKADVQYLCTQAAYLVVLCVYVYIYVLVYKCRTIIVQWFPVLINVTKMSHTRILFCEIHY